MLPGKKDDEGRATATMGCQKGAGRSAATYNNRDHDHHNNNESSSARTTTDKVYSANGTSANSSPSFQAST